MVEVVTTDNLEKKPWQSKTLWLSALTAIAPLFPTANDFITSSPGTFGAILGVAFFVLRLVTKGSITID